LAFSGMKYFNDDGVLYARMHSRTTTFFY